MSVRKSEAGTDITLYGTTWYNQGDDPVNDDPHTAMCHDLTELKKKIGEGNTGYTIYVYTGVIQSDGSISWSSPSKVQ